MLKDTIKNLPTNAKVMDFGCFGWTLYEMVKALRPDIQNVACDMMQPSDVPSDVDFYLVDDQKRSIPCANDSLDLVVASHVFEHVSDPIDLFQELGRVCKPGGSIYIEAPSDRSCFVKSSSFPHSHSFDSFWDDPTHIRPWPPAALYRLAISFGFEPQSCGYLGDLKDKLMYPFNFFSALVSRDSAKLTEAFFKAHKWSSGMVAVKPLDQNGAPKYVYISLKGVDSGVDNALDFRASLMKVDR